MNDVPLVVLAAEVNQSVDQLAADLDGHISVNDAGLRVVQSELAAMTIAAAREARAIANQRREREAAELQARRARGEAQRQAQRAVDQARAQRQREILATNGDLDAFAVMRMASGDDGGLSRAGRRFDELVRQEPGTSITYHPIAEEQ